MSDKTMDELVAKSAHTDIQVLLTAKENAKRAVLENSSPANIAALERASKMLEEKMQAKENLKSIGAVLEYIKENGHKIGQTKLYEDINKYGRIKRQKDGTFKERDVRRYMVGLPTLGTSDAVAEKAADRQKRKEEEEIRRIKTVADREEFDLAVKKGKYILKEQVNIELAARAITLSTGLKTTLEARALEIVSAVDGSPKKLAGFHELITNILDEALNEYSREMEYEVIFDKVE